MARPLRKTVQGVTYHCYTRCHGKRNLLKSRYGKKYFIEAVKMCQEKYDFRLIAAETVSNHIHLVIQTLEDKETISRIMQYIKARIAEKYNRATGETGPFWNERFGSAIIEESENPEQYLLWLLWYIGYNPVRKGISRDPRENEIGFINCYLNENFISPLKFTLHEYFYRLGTTFKDCADKFLGYEDAYRKRLFVWI
ncbi:MAG TPA: transposase [Spirochaetota bacterium]|nr:transposase [Spirochaetota bacterium]HPJ35472.1 transposase [Spirochaetota bacterium]